MVPGHSEGIRVHVARFDDRYLDEPGRLLEHDIDHFASNAHLTDPADADLIVIAAAHVESDWLLPRLRSHRCWTEHPHKVVVYDARDRPWCWGAGAYASMPARGFQTELQVAVPYLFLDTDRLTPLRHSEPDRLFGFVGRRTHRSRDAVFQLSSNRAHIVDAGSAPLRSNAEHEPIGEIPGTYEHHLASTQFVLCPRGHGTSSYRLFEALAAGRVPVIISDQYVLPTGPDWSEISLRIPESEIASIESVLDRQASRYDAMSRAASDAYDEFFSHAARCSGLLESLAELVRRGAPARLARSGLRDRYYFEMRARDSVRRLERQVRRAAGSRSG